MQANASQRQAGGKQIHGWPLDVSAILLLLASLLVYFQYHTLAKLSGAPTVKRYASPAEFVTALQASPLGLSDALVAVLILAMCVSLLVLELKERRLTRFF
ncbi:MAG: hypothetical protein QGI83_15010, partial [Candidatus Latescibacteria bacterium]|nr:hypothetical protein [Candidatus Latescibacterota bacterium]